MADSARSSHCIPLRKPITALLTDRRKGVRLPVTIVALAADAIRFICGRSLPPGSRWTIVVRRVPPLEIEITLRSAYAGERDTFACEAGLGRLHEADRIRFAALLPREPSAQRV